MSQDTLLLLWEIPLDCTEYNKEVFIRACISLTPKSISVSFPTESYRFRLFYVISF